MTDNNESLRPEDFEPHRIEPADRATKASLTDLWKEQPFVRLGVILLPVIAVVILVLGVFGHNKPAPVAPSSVGPGSSIAPNGKGGATKAYQEAVEVENKARDQEAKNTGTSAIPTELGIANSATSKTNPMAEFEPPKAQAPINTAQDTTTAPPVPPPAQVEPPQPKYDPQQLQAMADAMRTIMGSVQVKTPTIIQGRAQKSAEASPAAAPLPLSTEKQPGKILVRAGTVLYAQTLTEADSDVPAPILATILSGPFTNCRAIGTFQKTDDYLVLAFGTIIKGDKEYRVNAIAIDPDTTLDALETSIDHHYFERFVLPAAAGFISGVGNYAQQAGSTVTNSTYGITQSYPPLNTHQEIIAGLGQSANAIANVINQDSNVQPTIYVAGGTAFGMMFVNAVHETNE